MIYIDDVLKMFRNVGNRDSNFCACVVADACRTVTSDSTVFVAPSFIDSHRYFESNEVTSHT